MPFLGEIERIETRCEDRVEIYAQQIVEILSVLGGERIGGPVARRERVHERVERTAKHHEERVAHRKVLAPAQRHVLEYVRHPRIVLRNRTQGDQEGIVVVAGGEVKIGRAGGAMRVLLEGDVERLDTMAGNRLECRMRHGSSADV